MYFCTQNECVTTKHKQRNAIPPFIGLQVINMDSNKAVHTLGMFFSWAMAVFVFAKVMLYLYCLTADSLNPLSADAFQIPELMINYQGGFIRRGLLGELLYQAFLLHPFSVYSAIAYLEVTVFIVFLCVSIWIFRKLHYAPIMPFAILVGSVTAYRRDFLILLIAFAIFYLLARYATQPKRKHLVGFIMLTVLAILIYEPSFFFIVPISALIFYRNCSKGSPLTKTALTFALLVITMIAVCMAKGTASQANAIWQSWSPMFDYLNITQPDTPYLIEFLAKSESVQDVAMFHLRANFGIGKGFDPLLLTGSIVFFIGMYFLTITIPRHKVSGALSQTLSSIYLFQFVCLLPMFTILSCDFGRTILYVIFTSYYLEYLTKKFSIKIPIPFVDSFSEGMVSAFLRVTYPRLFLLHLLVLALIPFNMVHGISITSPFLFNDFIISLKTCYNLILSTFLW